MKKLNLGEVYADNKDFRTESQPKVPDLSITPADGKMYETNFNITVAAKGPADENKGLTYMLWGEIIKSDSSETELIKNETEQLRRENAQLAAIESRLARFEREYLSGSNLLSSTGDSSPS